MTKEPDSINESTYSTEYHRDPPGEERIGINLNSDHPALASPDFNPMASLAELRLQVKDLSRQLEAEHLTQSKLLALCEFGSNQDHAPDPERAAHQMAKMIYRLIHAELVCIFLFSPVEQRFKLMASAGPSAGLIPGSFQPDTNLPLVARAIAEKTVLSSRDAGGIDPLLLRGQRYSACAAAPLFRGGILRGLILLNRPADQEFSSGDLSVISTGGVQLLNAWENARYNETLTEFLQTVTLMSVVQEAGSLMEMIASIGRRTLGAAFTLVAALSPQEWTMRGSGRAPKLLKSLKNGAHLFLQEAIKSPYTFRLLDLTQDERTAAVELDGPELSSLLASPIRINGTTTGVLLAFGKIGAEGFNESDVFLAELLASHAAVNLESCYLNQELRASLKITQLLYDLSLNITRAGSLTDAARAIGLTAYRLLQARKCGLVLFSGEGLVEAEVHFPADDLSITHPTLLIQQAMNSRQTIYLADNEKLAHCAIPIQTNRRCYGALWLEFMEDNDEPRHPAEEIRILVNQAAVALERSILLEETRQKADEITSAYEQLEQSYDQTLRALTRAQDVRDNDTEQHSERVAEMAVRLGAEMDLSVQDLKSLERGALLHDLGKIGVPDGILRKSGPLDESEWLEMRKHPEKGAQIIGAVPALNDVLPVIASHHELWDGSGYPQQLLGPDIPLLARIFTVVDVFDAITSNRPYRTALSVPDALEYLENQAGILYDPEIVARFVQMMRNQC